jgi:hypothetical protein
MSAPASRHDEAGAALREVYELLVAIRRRAREAQPQDGEPPTIGATADPDQSRVETRR